MVLLQAEQEEDIHLRDHRQAVVMADHIAAEEVILHQDTMDQDTIILDLHPVREAV